jgi:hypothetical protein
MPFLSMEIYASLFAQVGEVAQTSTFMASLLRNKMLMLAGVREQ